MYYNLHCLHALYSSIYVYIHSHYMCHVLVTSFIYDCIIIEELQIKILHDGKTSYHGHVMLHYAGSWHVLCDQGWSHGNGAEVVCRELGLGKALEYGVVGTTASMKDFLVTNTQCIGQEPFFKSCSRQENLWNINNTCPSNTVAHLYCEGLCNMHLMRQLSCSQIRIYAVYSMSSAYRAMCECYSSRGHISNHLTGNDVVQFL